MFLGCRQWMNTNMNNRTSTILRCFCQKLKDMAFVDCMDERTLILIIFYSHESFNADDVCSNTISTARLSTIPHFCLACVSMKTNASHTYIYIYYSSAVCTRTRGWQQKWKQQIRFKCTQKYHSVFNYTSTAHGLVSHTLHARYPPPSG